LDLPLPFGNSGSAALPFLAGTSLLVFAATAVFLLSLLGFAFAAALAGVFCRLARLCYWPLLAS
jgi:hypothetical protein